MGATLVLVPALPQCPLWQENVWGPALRVMPGALEAGKLAMHQGPGQSSCSTVSNRACAFSSPCPVSRDRIPSVTLSHLLLLLPSLLPNSK
jgi:hypothetical protein